MADDADKEASTVQSEQKGTPERNGWKTAALVAGWMIIAFSGTCSATLWVSSGLNPTILVYSLFNPFTLIFLGLGVALLLVGRNKQKKDGRGPEH